MRMFLICLMTVSTVCGCGDQTVQTPAAPLAEKAPREPVLTEASILAMLDSLQEAAGNRHASDLLEHLAEDAIIIMSLRSDTLVMGPQQYLKRLEATWAGLHEYSYVMKDIKIAVRPDGEKAMVTYTAMERTLRGSGDATPAESEQPDPESATFSKSKERMLVVISNGKPKIMESRTIVTATDKTGAPPIFTSPIFNLNSSR